MPRSRNADHNGTIAAGGSVTIGFRATHTGETAEPGALTLNVASCSVT